MKRITRDEFIEWLRQSFPDNVDIEFRRVWQEFESGKMVKGSEPIYLDNTLLNTINFSSVS